MNVPEEIVLKLTPGSRKSIGALMERSGLELPDLFVVMFASFDALQYYQGDGATIIIRQPNGQEIKVPSLWDFKR